MDKIKHLTEENFEAEVANGVVLVDFFAEWCGPCRMLAPVVEELSKEMDNVTFCKLDIDQHSKPAGNHQVTSIPTLLLFKDGTEVARSVGLKDKEALAEFVKQAL
ncbi:MAG: Thioredoxin [Chlamydiia bacterium]|nr:Thioredoxin [Chlamydiia bacterium]MCH9616513.1 Thioredoxin [Chlamydiia bacterium]MCH9629501.1 Thioredoxin [Chlamydiia bacterium]